MEYYRFHLQKYKYGSKVTCPGCGRKRCLVRYVDEEGQIDFPETVGKCDHESSCGYHYTPKEYFHDNPSFKTKSISVMPYNACKKREIPHFETSYIPVTILNQTCGFYNINPLYRYLSRIYGIPETDRLFKLYHVGTSYKWGGSTVYWQIDIDGRVRTGKIMSYNSETGHRIKEPHAYVTWAHSELKLRDFHLKQCLFGEHLLGLYPDYPVVVVESEKTAIIMSHFIQDYLWLATGGKNGCFNQEAMKVLQGRDVILMPDLGATDTWKEKASMLSTICNNVIVSDMLEKVATSKEVNEGLDIADYFLQTLSKDQLLQMMIGKHPCIKILIDELKLKIVE